MGEKRPRLSIPALQMKGADDLLQRVAVDLFMRAVRELRPEIIQHFAERVKDASDPRCGRPNARMSKAFTRWAEASKLVPPTSVFGWAMRTRTEWRDHPDMLSALNWTLTNWASSAFTESLYEEWPSNVTIAKREPGAALEAFPEMESRRAFLARATDHWEARVNALKKDDRFVPTGTIAERDLRWLARFQVGGENYSQISRSPQKVRQATVKQRVEAAARVLGIELRSQPRGRPRNP